MFFFLGIFYIIGSIVCSIIVLSACMIHGRSSRNAPQLPQAHARPEPFVPEREKRAISNASDAEPNLAIRPA